MRIFSVSDSELLFDDEHVSDVEHVSDIDRVSDDALSQVDDDDDDDDALLDETELNKSDFQGCYCLVSRNERPYYRVSACQCLHARANRRAGPHIHWLHSESIASY
jgi:hypothetical protein